MKFERGTLVLILVFSAFLRILSCAKYIDGDETPIFINIIWFFYYATMVPWHFNYPTLFSYLSAVPVGIGAVVYKLLGILPKFEDIWVLYETGSVLPILPSRLISVFFGVLTIYLAYKIGKKFFDEKAGIIAAACLAFSRIHINYSSFALPDVTMTFFSALSLYFSLSALKSKSAKDFVLAGFFAGLATSTKYNAFLTIIPVAVVYLYSIKKVSFKKPALSALAFIIAFFIGSPAWLIVPEKFEGAFNFEKEHMLTGHLGSFGAPYITHIELLWDWEDVLAVLFLCGTMYGLIRHRKEDILILTLVFVSFFYIGSWQKKDIHYLLFLFPALSIFAGNFLSRLYSSLSKKIKPIGSLLVMLLVFIHPVSASFTYSLGKLTREDTRDISRDWINKNIPENSSVILDWNYNPYLLNAERKENISAEHREFFDKYLGNRKVYNTVKIRYNLSWLAEVNAEYLLINDYCFNRFLYTSAPSKDNPLYENFTVQKETYVGVLNNSQGLNWALIKEFNTNAGPVILLYKRTT